MKNILGELWHGNITPQEDCRNNTPEMKQLMDYIARHHNDLLKMLTDEQRDIFERFDDCFSEYASLAEEAIFVYAFRLGARLMPGGNHALPPLDFCSYESPPSACIYHSKLRKSQEVF